MAAGMLAISNYTPARDRNGRLVPGARLDVYQNRTTTRVSVYANAALTIPLPNPVIANASGVFPAVWAEGGSLESPILYQLAYSASDGSSIGNPSSFSDVQPGVSLALADADSRISVTGDNLQGSNARTFSIRQGLEPQVLDYIPTSLHAAIQAGTSTVDVADYVEAALRDGAGRFPAAQLTLGRKITVPEATGLQMRGLDPHRTRLRWTAASAGIELTFSDFNRPPIVDSIGFFTTQNSQGTGLSIIGGLAVSQNRIGPQVSNLRFGGATANENESGFAKGLLMSRVWFPRIDRVSVKGFYDGSLVYGMTASIELDRVQAPSIKGAVLLHAQTGIRQTGNESPNPYGEGVNISDFEIVGVNTGIILAHSGGTPGTSIHDGHINASDVGISATNHWQTSIHDLLLYKTSGPTATDWIGLDMTDARDCFVHHIVAGGDPTMGGHTDRAVRITRGADNKVQDILCDTFGGNAIGVEVRDTALDTEVTGVREGVSVAGSFTPILVSGGNRGIYRDNLPLSDQNFPANNPTPSVENSLRDEWSTNNSSATTYTNFTGGSQGQVLEILIGDSNTTIAHNATINLQGGAFTAANGSILTLKFRNGIWREIARRTA